MAGVKKQDDKESSGKLRSEAEKKVARIAGKSAALKKLDLDKLVQELQIHQVELEMQNEELRRTQEELQVSKEQYFKLYDMAPVGYFSLSEQGIILEANLTGASMLGVAPRNLRSQRFTKFVIAEDQDTYYLHRRQLFDTRAPQVCEMRMARRDGSLLWARIEASLAQDSRSGKTICLATMSDITNQRKSVEDLRESEEKYHIVADFTYDWEYWLSPEGQFIYVSPSCKIVTGYEPEAFMHDPDVMLKIIHPDDRESLVRHRKESSDPHISSNPLDFRIITRDGEERWIAHRCRKIYSPAGKYLGVRGSNRDITRRKHSEQALEESEKKYRLLADNTADGVWLLDMNLNLTYCSPSSAKQSGFTLEEILDMSMEQYFAPESLKVVADAFLEELPKIQADPDYNPLLSRDLEFYKKDGTTFWAESKFSVIRDKNGKAVSILAVARDITERMLAQKAVKESQKKYQSLVETTNDFIWEMDLNGVYTYCSPQIEKLWGFKPDEMLGKTPFDLVPPEDREQAINAFSVLAESALPFKNLEIRSLNSAGRIVFLEINGGPYFDKEGKPCGYRGITRDITKRKKAEDSILGKQLLLARTEGIAHLGSWEWDIATDTVTWSDELFRIFQRDPQEGAPSFAEHPAFYHADDFALLRQAVEVAIADGTPYELELRANRKDGETRVCRARGLAERAPDGRVVRLFGSLQDITERKKMQEVVRESEARYRLLAEHTTDIIRLLNMNLKTTYVSPSAEKQRGFTNQEMVEMPLEKQLAPESLNLAIRIFSEELPRVKADPGYNPVYTLDLEYYRKDGTTVWEESKFSVIRDNSGAPVSILAEARDVTGRKQAEQALSESEKKYRNIFNNAILGIFQTTPDGRIKTINPAFANMLGFSSPEEMATEVVHIGDELYANPQERLQLIDRLKSEGMVRDFATQLRRKDGSLFWFSTNVQLIDVEGNDPFIEGTGIDISERRQAEEKLVKSYESLKKALNDAINTIVKIVELRDPYTAGHQQKVSDLATAIAREMQLEDDRVEQIRTAAIVHDIGKMYVPSDILSKPGKLSNIELGLIKTHSQSGYDIVKGMDLPQHIAETVLQHHERLDGSGYPNQLKAADTLLEAKILAVADVIEAMASHRPYRPALGIDKALEEISSRRGVLYDCGAVDACLALFSSGRFVFKA